MKLTMLFIVSSFLFASLVADMAFKSPVPTSFYANTQTTQN